MLCRGKERQIVAVEGNKVTKTRGGGEKVE